ncbi:unnamed protein product [Pedinophyceae sp. YPF-701]|nr:unnamed protein product [Pedinophyceae sp. YPF-701]
MAADAEAPKLNLEQDKSYKVTLEGGEVAEGTVYAVDPAAGIAVFVQPGDGPHKYMLRILPLAVIKSAEEVAANPCRPPDDITVDNERIARREQEAWRRAEDDMLRYNPDVDQDAQNLFHALCKTMDCRWDGASMVVLQEVVVRPPYTAADCHPLGPHTPASSLERIRKVLEGERAKLSLAVGSKG